MKWIWAFMVFAAVVQTRAQQPVGFCPSAARGPVIKLQGFVVHQVTGGYLALSVPEKDIKRFCTMAEILSGHYAELAVLEHLEKESRSVAPMPGLPSVPIGSCFLSTNEVFPRHKILNRKVQAVGTYIYVTRRGRTITVEAYSGGPS
jgi:hypothetical protein